ncbi:DUF3119 family protein [Prochlorothrix hollandica]|uniref:DUF3119 family protein n=1 Tax=Prochlorothrix hollandica TaxID=1223 RepID=UPI0033429095
MIQSLFKPFRSRPKTYTAVELRPSYRVPLGLLILAGILALVQPIVATLVGLLGLLLVVQTKTLRFCFTETDFDLYRGQTCIRSFPYANWSNWRIFWTPVPMLFYFREVNSIHFLPIVFDPQTLQACLEERCPRLD